MFRHVGKRPSQGEILVAIQGLQRSLSIRWQEIRGRAPRRVSEDRRVLEQEILPAYAREPGITRVLFAGCASYTQHYEALFAGHEYWSIDPVAARQRHGARRHIGDSLQHLAIHVPAGYFDLIVCNGVLGWGLNAPEEADAAFAACHAALREGGHLLLGWNDLFPRNRVVPDELQSLARFERAPFGPFAARFRIEVAHRHVFDFYRKPAMAPPRSP
jgi:SAM-dependent methyltransferase